MQIDYCHNSCGIHRPNNSSYQCNCCVPFTTCINYRPMHVFNLGLLMYAGLSMYVGLCRRVCMYVSVCMYTLGMYVCMYVCMYACMYVYMCLYVCIHYVCMCVCTYVCMHVCMYAFPHKSNDNFYHIKHNTGLYMYVTSVTCSPHAHFRKKHKYLKFSLLQWSSYIIRNILFISTCHYATNTRNMTTEEGLLKLVAEIAVVRI